MQVKSRFSMAQMIKYNIFSKKLLTPNFFLPLQHNSELLQ